MVILICSQASINKINLWFKTLKVKKLGEIFLLNCALKLSHGLDFVYWTVEVTVGVLFLWRGHFCWWLEASTQQHSSSLSEATCASEGAALGSCGCRRLVPLRRALQQVVQTPKAARQIAQETLLPWAVLGRHASSAHVGGWISCSVTAGVAQRLVGMRALGMTNVQIAERRLCSCAASFFTSCRWHFIYLTAEINCVSQKSQKWLNSKLA